MLLKGKRIFIVEDDIKNRIIYQHMLLQHGAIVEFERWGNEAISRLRAFNNVDLIVLDLMLARGASGFTIFDQIRANPKYENVPIIAVSAWDPSEAIPKVREKGFDGFIAKPIDDVAFPQQLAQVINKESIWHTGGPYVPSKS